MEKAILEAFKQLNLEQDKKVNVTVALSGGADSMALLYALNNLKEKLSISIDAAHLNHGIRGKEAERDQLFVREQCKKLGIRLHEKKVDVPLLAKEHKQSCELAARNARYEFLEQVNTGYVATAHTASDNLETVLLNLARGTSLTGLCGIPLKRDIFIRPLLCCTRDDIEAYCEQNNISFITDSTNLSDDYTRNKIRHKIIPILKEINPSVEAAVKRTTLNLSEDASALSNEAFKYLASNMDNKKRLVLSDFEKLDLAVAKRVLKTYVEQAISGISLESVHINGIYDIALSGGRVSLPQDKEAVSVKNIFYVDKQKNEDFPEIQLQEYNAEEIKELKKINNLFLNNAIDCDKIIGKLKIRTRISGDSVRLKNRGCTKTLNKLFNEEAVPISKRDVLPVISDDKGVIWIYGFGVANRCAISDKTVTAIFPTDKAKGEV